MSRKPFSKLSVRQKRRRSYLVNLTNVEYDKSIACAEENRLPTRYSAMSRYLPTPENNRWLGRAEFVDESHHDVSQLGNSLDLLSCSNHDGNIEPTKIDDSSDQNPFSNVIGYLSIRSCNLDTY